MKLKIIATEMSNRRTAKQAIETLLETAGVKRNGNRPGDIQVHDEGLYERLLSGGALARGESYMDGWWDAPALDEFIRKILSAKLETAILGPSFYLSVVKANLINMQTKTRSKKVAKEHYDIGNDFYAKMLDKRLLYTCAYWKDTHSLDEAQENKLHLICKKLELKKGDRLLDIGCGWGSLAKFAAENYGGHVTAVNISEEQVKVARESTKGLPVEVLLKDYRDVEGTFDKVSAIGVIEHIGYKNYRGFMETVNRVLKPGGLFLLHGIASNKSSKITDPWKDRHIFPNSMLPSANQLTAAMEKIFVIEDWHSFGPDYDKTLMAWDGNFEKHWPEFNAKSGDRFYRMWKYYLLSCAGAFRARSIQLWQIVLSKGGVPGGYTSVR